MIEFRWMIWRWASWLAWWLCPDKKALSLISKYGTIAAREALGLESRK